MAPAQGRTRDDPIVLGEEPAFFDLTLSDNDEVRDTDGDYDDLLELSESPDAWRQAQSRRNSTRGSVSVQDSPSRSNDHASLQKITSQPLLAERNPLNTFAVATTTNDRQHGDAAATDGQEQEDRKARPPDTQPVQKESTPAPAGTTSLLRTASPADINNVPKCGTPPRANASTTTVYKHPLVVSPMPKNREIAAPDTAPIVTQIAVTLTENREHERIPGSSTSQVEQKRGQTLSELTTTNTGLMMSDRVNGFDAPLKDREIVQPLVFKKNEKAIKSAKPSGRPKIQGRPRGQVGQRIFNTSDEAQLAPTARPTDKKLLQKESEVRPAAVRELSGNGKQEAAAAPRIDDRAPATVFTATQPLPNVKSLNPTRQPSRDYTLDAAQSTVSQVLITADKACPDFGEGKDLGGLVDSIHNTMEHALQIVQRCLHRHLDDRHGTHAYLTRAALRRHRTCQERDIRVRTHQKLSAPLGRCSQTVSPFEGMTSIQVPLESKTRNKLRGIQQKTFSKSGSKAATDKSWWGVQSTNHTSNAVVIPKFKEYVTLKKSILSDNESKLLTTPMFDDLDDRLDREVRRLLPQNYIIRNDENANIDLRAEQCRFYEDTIELFLKELGISWDDIIFWLLTPAEDLNRLNKTLSGSNTYDKVVLDRSDFEKDTFTRDEDGKNVVPLFDRTDRKWRQLLLRLRKPTVNRLRISALACKAIFEACDFSIWYLVKRCDVVRSHVLRNIKSATNTHKSTYRTVMCRVCHEHNCLEHGEIREHPTDYSDVEETSQSQNTTHSDDGRDGQTSTQSSDTKTPAHMDDDSDIENVINYRIPVNADAPNQCLEAIRFKKPPEVFRASWWKNNTATSWDHRQPFFPCNHEGRCDEAKCRCYRENITCEKTCKCSSSCNRRFPGCNSTCALAGHKRVCIREKCMCIMFGRECDADICGACGATEVLDPVNRYDETVVGSCCRNVSIQRGVPKKTLLGHSEVHGFGLYCGEAIKKDDFICEYTGETLSVEESDRRHTIYEYQQTWYTFKLNEKQEVDATYMGNKSRFINNADLNLANCHAKNVMCNTVSRIGLYASIDMEPGTELFFHYNYDKDKMKGYKQPKSQVVTVKQKTPSAKCGSKPNTNALSSDDEASQSVSGQSSGRHKSLSKARAAKAAKSATRANTLPILHDTEDEGAETSDYYLAEEIKDTDEDEVEFQPDVEENSDGNSLDGLEETQGEIIPRQRGRPRNQPNSVVAVKQRGRTHLGKRKR